MKKLTLILILLAAVAQSFLAQAKVTQTGHILSASDIHLNPYYDPSLVNKLVTSPYQQWQAIFESSAKKACNSYDTDSNYQLFKSALMAMKKQNPSPAFVVITGDFLCHSFQKNFSQYAPTYPDSLISFTSKTIRFMAAMFKQTFPNTVILPVLGNNDSYCGDYTVEPNGPFLSMFAKAWVPLQHNNNAAADQDFIRQFSKGGYYTYALRDGSGGTMVMLNTIFFARTYSNCGKATYNPAATELNWLSAVLNKQSKLKGKVWLAAHIPPGINVYSSINGKGTCSQNAQLMLNDSCNTVYLKLLTQYAPGIKASFAGHTHMDDFRVLYNATGTPISFIHITPAVSPKFDNNPGFQTLSYSKATFSLTNIQTYYYSLSATIPVWGLEYDFDKTYRVDAINPITMDKVRQQINTNPATLNNYINFYDVSNPKSDGINQGNWKGYWCGTGCLTTASFINCYCGAAAQ